MQAQNSKLGDNSANQLEQKHSSAFKTQRQRADRYNFDQESDEMQMISKDQNSMMDGSELGLCFDGQSAIAEGTINQGHFGAHETQNSPKRTNKNDFPELMSTPKTARTKIASHVEEKVKDHNMRQSLPHFFGSPDKNQLRQIPQGGEGNSEPRVGISRFESRATSEMYPHEVSHSVHPSHISSNVTTPRDEDEDSDLEQVQFIDRAIPLITCVGRDEENGQQGHFEVSEEAVKIIKQIKGPIGVITVAGMYRTGKSYLLNRVLLNRQKGFGVGPSINPCTKGLWMWGTPLSGFSSNGEPCTVIIVDSEGIGGLDEDNNHDVRIFSLAVLLSSYFIYNSMGQIDENALTNLSLVVNLTQHIQTTSSGGKIEDYMPSFMWVIRDFVLQLLDENGCTITSQQYLEKALEFKGENSKDPKNQIRASLKKYFTRRDCSTMIRPVMDEDQLQELENMDLDDFRPEFIEQMMSLRHRILHKMQIKSIHGNPMDGSTWIKLVEVYVKTINEGGIPNIESSWTYICQQKAQERQMKAFKKFEKEVSTIQIPNHQHEVDRLLEEAKLKTVTNFLKDFDVDDKILNEHSQSIQQSLNEKTVQVKQHNHAQCQEFSQNMLQHLFGELDQIQQTQDPQKSDGSENAQIEQFFTQIEFALREMSIYYQQNCFEFPEKNLYLAEAKSQYLTDFLQTQSKSMVNQQRLHTEMEEQMQQKLASQLRESRETSHTEKIRLEGLLKAEQVARSEVEVGKQVLQEQFQKLKIVHASDSEAHNTELQNLRAELQKEQSEKKSTQEAFDEQTKDLQRAVKKSQSEFDKEKALLEQKIDFLEKALHEKTEKEKDSSSQWSTQKSELSQEIKQVCAKYENEIKALATSLEEEKEKASDADTRLQARELELNDLKQKMQEVESTLKNQLSQAQVQIKEMQTTANQIKNENQQQSLSYKLKQREGDFERAQKLLEETQQKLKESQESQQQTSHDSMKTIAVRDQKIEFLTMQLNEAKEQLEDSQRQHAKMCQTLQSRQQSESSDGDDQHAEKIEALQKEFQSTSEEQLVLIKNLTAQNEELQQKLNEADLAQKLNANELNRQLEEVQQAQDEVEKTKFQLQERIKSLETQRARQAEEAEESVNTVSARFEKDIKDKEEQFANEVKELQMRSEDQLSQMKNFYEIEKDKIELRVNEEKERSNKRINQIQEEFEHRYGDSNREKDAEIELLQNQLRELDQHQQSYEASAEHELSMKIQQIENLEHAVADARERLSQVETSRNSAFERQIESFESQRHELNAKIDKLLQDSLDKDKKLASYEHKSERDQELFERKQNEAELNITHAQSERDQATEKLTEVKTKLSEIQDESMQHKLESGREQALLTQQIEFQNRKINELQCALDENQRGFEIKLKSYRQEIIDDAQGQIERITGEKELWESKYEQKRKALKEVENNLGKQNGELQQEIAIIQSQNTRIEREKIDIENSLHDEIDNLQAQLASSLDSNAGQAEFMHGSAEDLMRLKQELQETERQLIDMQSTYDRDKALWEGKVQFLENQKGNYKRDLVESQKKFEMTLEQLQKRGSFDKGKMENYQNTMLRTIENKYKQQIKEMIETHNAVTSESQNRARRAEAELAQLKEMSEKDNKGKGSQIQQLDRKLQEAQDSEQKLQVEIEEISNERNRRVSEFQKQLDKEKSSYKTKIAEAERKAKEAETKRAQLRITMEKERANWRLEADQLRHLEKKQIEVDQYVQNLERSKEQLKKENEKMRQELKGFKNIRVTDTMSNNGNGSVGPSPHPPRKAFQFSTAISQVQNAAKQNKDSHYFSTGGIHSSGGRGDSLNNSMNQGSQGGAGSIVSAAISRLKENQQNSFTSKIKRASSPLQSLNHSNYSNGTTEDIKLKNNSQPYQNNSSGLKIPPLPTGQALQNRYQQPQKETKTNMSAADALDLEDEQQNASEYL